MSALSAGKQGCGGIQDAAGTLPSKPAPEASVPLASPPIYYWL